MGYAKPLQRLNDRQRDAMSAYADSWIERGLRATPLSDDEWRVVSEGMRRCYEYAGIAWHDNVVRVGSPIVGALAAPAAAFAICLIRDVRRSDDTELDAVRDAVRGAVGGAVRGAVGDAVHGAIRGAISGAVDDAVHDAVRGAVGGAVRGAIRGAVGGAVHDAVDGSVRGAVDDAVHDAISGAVDDAVHGAIRGAVDDAISAAVDGAISAAISGAIRGAVGGAIRGAISGAISGAVGGAVGGAVDDAVDDAVHGAIRGAISGAVDDAVRDAVRGAVGGAVDDAVDGSVRDAVRDAVYGAVGGAVYGAVHDVVGRCWYKRLGGRLWAGWNAYLSFFHDVVKPDVDNRIWEKLDAYNDAQSAGWWWPFRDFVMVCDTPSEIRREQVLPRGRGSHRLHCADGPAIAWRDGYNLYFWHGLNVPAWVIESPDIDRAIAEPNTEIRRAAMEVIGWDKFIDRLGEPIDRCPDPGNPPHELVLYRIPDELNPYQMPVNLLFMVNGSPDRSGRTRHYGETCPAEISTALAAAAWQYQVSPDVYATLSRRT